MSARSAVLLLAVALSCGPAFSDQSLPGLVFVQPRPNPAAAYRFFGDQIVAVPLLVHAAAQAGLTIRAGLVQLTSRLSAPVAVDLPVTLSTPHMDFSVALPAVQRETDFELRFRSRRPGDRDWQAAGRIALRVYPADLLSPVRTWAESHALRVEDDDGALTEFFRRHGIPLADRPGPSGVTLFAGPQALQKHARRPLREGETAVLFSERETEVPHVLIDRSGQGITVRVEMRIAGRLATDPFAQKMLLELFQLLHEQTPSGKGVLR